MATVVMVAAGGSASEQLLDEADAELETRCEGRPCGTAAVERDRSDDRELAMLKRWLLIEQIKFYRAANEQRARAEDEWQFEEFLRREYGYPAPRRRPWGRR